MTEENHKESVWRWLKNFWGCKQQETVRETIEDLIEEASSEGDCPFSEHEQLLLNNILYLKDKKCCHAMVPRANIIAFPKSGTVKELAELMVTRGHSRIPIYGDSLDDILGIIHIIDLAKCLLKNEDNLKVEELIKVEEMVNREVKFVSPSMRVLDLLRDMQANKIHMAMVVDEYGGIDGLVTIEDLLEEIVGDIEDEYDFEEQPVILLQDEGLIIADARAELDEIKEVTHLDLCKNLDCDTLEIDTLGGYVFHIAQRIPSRGEVIDGPDGIKFRILEVDPRRIKKVMIVIPKTGKKENSNAE